MSLPDNFPLEPFDDVIIIKQTHKEETSFGLILPGKTGKLPSGRVVAVGPGRTYSFFMDASGNTVAGKFVPVQVKVGDFVVFGKYANSGGEPIEFNGEKYILARVGDLAGRSRSGDEIEVRLAEIE